jgi:proton-translocating NADH-quinone oxidoreductase chain L
MYVLPLLSTLLAALFAGFGVSRAIGYRGVTLYSSFSLFVACVSSLTIWYEVVYAGGRVELDLLGPWFTVGSFNATWTLRYDILAAHMLATVTTVSFAVHLYALNYMRADPHLTLFMCYLSLFTHCMLLLVTADNLLVTMVGWEGIGVCSYLLIGYYTHRLSAVKAAQQAILVNRISDGMLLWGILWVWHHTGSLEYDLVNSSNASSVPVLLGVAILIGAMGKSAQVLFHVWLPNAMEGPTPVSALIHAATLVTAGVFLVVRLTPFWGPLVVFIGACTAFMAATFGYMQADLKRVIAFSTCSQLGYMMVSCGLGEYGTEAAMAHLMTHASFKAALFLAAGVIITSAGGQQHTSRYGALSAAHCTQLCLSTFMAATLCLIGLPESSGFQSKEAILNLAAGYVLPWASGAHAILLLTALLTSSYSIRLCVQSFMLDYSGSSVSVTPAGKSPNLLYGAAFTVLMLDVLVKIWVGVTTVTAILPMVPWLTKTTPVGLVSAGILTALLSVSTNKFNLLRFFGTKLGFDQLYNQNLVSLVLDLGRLCWYTGDKGLFYVHRLY